MDARDRFRGCLLGLAAGDAVGTTVEFHRPGTFEPVTDMVGGGPFHLLPGEWTDDTSMALCLAASLVACEGFDPHDQLERYWRWIEEGYLSSNGRCFDVGRTVLAGMNAYRRTGDPFSGPTDPHSAGNGCIMRLAPVAMYYAADVERAEHFAGESSRTTHGARECVDASRLFARMLVRALHGASKEEVLLGDAHDFRGAPAIEAIARGAYRTKTPPEIRGTGYVVHCLEAALWCFDRTTSFRDAILTATNLGHDADTTAAVCGQIAGAFHGVSGIPAHWIEQLALLDTIEDLAARLHEGSIGAGRDEIR